MYQFQKNVVLPLTADGVYSSRGRACGLRGREDCLDSADHAAHEGGQVVVSRAQREPGAVGRCRATGTARCSGRSRSMRRSASAHDLDAAQPVQRPRPVQLGGQQREFSCIVVRSAHGPAPGRTLLAAQSSLYTIKPRRAQMSLGRWVHFNPLGK